MRELPEMIKQGEKARLFPVLADTSREGRIASIFLSLIQTVPSLAEAVLTTTGLRIGKRTQINTYTEIVLNDDTYCKNRPDGLIVVHNSQKTWTALIEAKIGKSNLDEDQVTRYLDSAKANKIDAVITISNQFVARANISPLLLSKSTLKKANLYHWSWTWIKTQCDIISHKNEISDFEQKFLLNEFMRLLEHPSTGIERFTQMNSSWKEVVQSVANQETLSKNSPEAEDTVSSWFQELRDMSLLLSSHIGQPVTEKIDRQLIEDAAARIKDGSKILSEQNKLFGSFSVPSTASNIDVCADLARRSIIFSMTLKAPQDRKSTKARVNWLLRMLKDDDSRLVIRAHWPGRKPPTQKELSVLRLDPESIDNDKAGTVPHSFEVLLIDVDAKRFSGRRTFIETIENCSKDFYDLVAQNLRAWQAPPPKPVKTAVEDTTDEDAEISDDV